MFLVRFYLETYGCSLNAADSDMMVGRLHQLGATRVDDVDEADLIIVNTCGVKEPTEDRIIFRLGELSALDKPVIVTGCLPKISLHRVETAIPNYAAILGPQSIDSLGDIAHRVIDGERGIKHLSSDSSSKLQFFEGPPDSVICTIPICEGCLGNCAYCAVKFARSGVRSYSIDEVFDVARRAIHTGYREVRLTAQDAGAFGHDTGETLVDLLSRLDTIAGDHRFRLGMFNPNLVIDYLPSLMDVFKSDHFFKFFHVPLQSGSDRILRLMRRKYSVSDWISVVDTIRRYFPNSTIATDIIVGFPGESDDDFEETIDVISSVRPQVVNISKYGDRPRTAASRSKDKVDTFAKKERSRRLSRLVHDMVVEDHRSWINKIERILVTGTAPKGGTMGRTDTYLPVIVVARIPVGSTVEVKIVDADKTHLVGVLHRA